MFCKVVAVAEAQVKRDGQVRAKGSPVLHATLGPLEERLESQAGTDVIGQVAGRAPLGARFVKGERERLLARAFMIRVIVLMTLMPGEQPGDVIAALAGDLGAGAVGAAVAGVGARAAGDWRNALGPVPLEGAAGPRAGIGLARAPRAARRGHHREEEAAEGGVAGRDPGPGAGHAREQGPASAPWAPVMTPARTRVCGRCR